MHVASLQTKSDLLSRFPQKIVVLPISNYLKHSILLNVKELKMKKGLRGKKPQQAKKEKALSKQFMLSAVKVIAEKVIATKAKKSKTSLWVHNKVMEGR
jgi:hypothetical protein